MAVFGAAEQRAYRHKSSPEADEEEEVKAVEDGRVSPALAREDEDVADGEPDEEAAVGGDHRQEIVHSRVGAGAKAKDDNVLGWWRERSTRGGASLLLISIGERHAPRHP